MGLNKKDLIDELLKKIRSEWNQLNVEEDQEGSQVEEVSPEDLKASTYLEGAQAKRAKELEDIIDTLENIDVSKTSDKVTLGAIVETDMDGEEQKTFFVLPTASGEKIVYKDKSIFIVTPNSPIGQRLMGKKVGEYFDLPVGSKVHEYEIIQLF